MFIKPQVGRMLFTTRDANFWAKILQEKKKKKPLASEVSMSLSFPPLINLAAPLIISRDVVLYIGSREIFSQGVTRALSPDIFLRNNIYVRACYNSRVSIPAASHDLNNPRESSHSNRFQESTTSSITLCITSRDYERHSLFFPSSSLSRIRFVRYKLYLKRFRSLSGILTF